MGYRKVEDDALLVTHPPVEGPRVSDRLTGETVDSEPFELKAEPEFLATRLDTTSDPEERKKLLAAIQQRFGNREAERILRTVHESREES